MSEALIAQGWSLRNSNGFSETVGPVWGRMEGDHMVFGIMAEDKHMNGMGAMHGGLLATLADNALGRATFGAIRPKVAVTVQLNLHYVSGVKKGDFVEARAQVVRATRSVIFMRGELTVAGRVVASADGVWKIIEVKTWDTPHIKDPTKW